MQPKYLKTEEDVFRALQNGGPINYLSSNGESIAWRTPLGFYSTNVRNVSRKDDGSIGSRTGLNSMPTPGLTERKSESSYYKGSSA